MMHIAIVIELLPWPPCPLTVAETQLEVRAGVVPAHGPFPVHVLDAIVYSDPPEWLVVGVAVFVCVASLLLRAALQIESALMRWAPRRTGAFHGRRRAPLPGGP